MPHWHRSTLGEVATIERRTVAAAEIYDGTIYVGLDNIEAGGSFVNVSTVARGQLYSSKFIFTKDHVLYGKLRPYLAKIARPEFDGVCSTDILPILPGPSINRDFLTHFLRLPTTIQIANSLATGANLPRLNPKILATFKIPVPPLAEQEKIAMLLDQTEVLRAKRREAIGALDELTESIFLYMFDSSRVTSESFLGEHLSLVTSGGRDWARFYTDKGQRFIRSLDVRMNKINNLDAVYVTPPDNAEARRTAVKPGDVLLTITGSQIGRVSTVPEELEGAHVSQHVAILRPRQDKIRSEYLSFFLSLNVGGQRQIASAQYGQTKPGLNFKQIREFKIPNPTLSLQDDFVARAAEIESLKNKNSAHLSELDALFASLQYRAFRGEL